jgi:hypothetical protein
MLPAVPLLPENAQTKTVTAILPKKYPKLITNQAVVETPEVEEMQEVVVETPEVEEMQEVVMLVAAVRNQTPVHPPPKDSGLCGPTPAATPTPVTSLSAQTDKEQSQVHISHPTAVVMYWYSFIPKGRL